MRKKYEKRPPNASHNPSTKRYLTAPQLRERYGDRSETWLDRIMKSDAAFPRPIYIGRFRFWALDAIETYERSVAARPSFHTLQVRRAAQRKQAEAAR
jgi:predicted DNA-binding transcriptional regulator AlpA